MSSKIKIAVLDDYQGAAFDYADWGVLNDFAGVTVFNDHLFEESEVADRLLPFEVVCVMRERTPLNRSLLTKLTNLKLIVSTGKRNASIDMKAVEELGIAIKSTGYVESGAPELTWALLMSLARNVVKENENVRAGRWQTTIGADLFEKTIGIIGLGRVGAKVAAYAKAFGMNVLAWSQNLTEEKAAECGALKVSKEALFSTADFVTVHLVLSERSKGIIDKDDFKLMKPEACFINTSRGQLVNEHASIEVLQQGRIAGAALDVFDIEPLPGDHPFRTLDNILVTPHIGYVTRHTYEVFYQDTVEAIQQWLIEQKSFGRG